MTGKRLARVFRVRRARRVGAVLRSAMLDLGIQGERGAVHLEVALNWFVGELPAKTREEYPPQGIAVYVHRAAPDPDGPVFPTSESLCEWLGGEQCWPERLPGADLALDLRDRGTDAVWEQLEQLYRGTFGS